MQAIYIVHSILLMNFLKTNWENIDNSIFEIQKFFFSDTDTRTQRKKFDYKIQIAHQLIFTVKKKL